VRLLMQWRQSRSYKHSLIGLRPVRQVMAGGSCWIASPQRRLDWTQIEGNLPKSGQNGHFSGFASASGY